MIYPGFCGSYASSQSRIANAEDLVNWYVQTLTVNSKAEKALYPTPGVVDWCQLPGTPARGIFLDPTGRIFAIAGGTPCEITDNGSSGAAVAVGGVMVQDANPPTIDSNGDGGGQLFIVSGNKGYILDVATLVLTEVVTNVLIGAFLDTFFLALDPASSTLKISDSNNGLTWDPTQFAQRSSASDRWASMIVGPGGGEVYLFGTATTDIWFNKGTAPFPLAPVQSAKIKYGTGAPFSVGWIGNGPIWLAQNKNGARTVQKLRGYDPVKVSTEPIDTFLAGLPTVADAENVVYEEEGHEFYALNFPTANKSIVWDDTEGEWHRAGVWNSLATDYDVWHPRCHAYVNNKHLVGDRATGMIHRMSNTFGLDAGGRPLRRLRQAAGLQRERKRLFFSAFELYLEVGLGVATGQGSDPQVMLRTSGDGGKTFGSIRSRSAGRRGKYNKRVRWNNLSAVRDRVDQIVVSDPIPWRILGAFLEPRGSSI
jgi:hypothetical protein